MERIHTVRFLLACLGLVLLFKVSTVVSGGEDPDGENPTGRIVYDQRQSGKYNIHVSIKDVAIIEMAQNEFADESFGDEDYYYDDSDLTVKPLLSLLSSVKPIATTSSSSLVQQSNSTVKPSGPDTPTTTAQPLLIPDQHSTSDRAHITLSPNLIADLAATQAAASFNASKITPNTSTPPPAYSQNIDSIKKTTNVVILATHSPLIENPISTHLPPPIGTELLSSRSTQHAVEEPILHPKTRLNNHMPMFYNRAPSNALHLMARNRNQDDDSKIFKFKVRSNNKRTALPSSSYPIPLRYNYGQRRCRTGHFLDDSGNCRMKRSSSFLNKLVSMLVSLPLSDRFDAAEDQTD